MEDRRLRTAIGNWLSHSNARTKKVRSGAPVPQASPPPVGVRPGRSNWRGTTPPSWYRPPRLWFGQCLAVGATRGEDAPSTRSRGRPRYVPNEWLL